MNVDSLRSGTEQNAESAEMKIAKVTSREGGDIGLFVTLVPNDL